MSAAYPPQIAPSPLLSRLHRWADSLPESEPIPVAAAEKYDLAEYAVNQRRFPSSEALKTTLESIERGSFRFRGHRVVVL